MSRSGTFPPVAGSRRRRRDRARRHCNRWQCSQDAAAEHAAPQ